MTIGTVVTASNPGTNTVAGTFQGRDAAGFALVQWTTPTGRTVTGRFATIEAR